MRLREKDIICTANRSVLGEELFGARELALSTGFRQAACVEAPHLPPTHTDRRTHILTKTLQQFLGRDPGEERLTSGC